MHTVLHLAFFLLIYFGALSMCQCIYIYLIFFKFTYVFHFINALYVPMMDICFTPYMLLLQKILQ